jgi:hypothetical protein
MSDNQDNANRLAGIYLASLRRRIASTKKITIEYVREDTLEILDTATIPVDTRITLALTILRRLDIPCPVKAEILSADEVGHDEHPEWLVMTYANQNGSSSKIRSASSADVKRGRLVPEIPLRNRM